MKKLIIIVIVLFLYESNLALAQRNFKAGLLTGIIGSQVSGDNLGGFNKPGLVAGAFVSRQLKNEKASLELQLTYIQKGSRKQVHLDKGDLTFYLLRLNYIEVPLLLKYKIKKFTYEVGPSVASLLKYSVQDQYGYIPSSSPEVRPFKRTDFCINAGINMPLGKRMEMNWRWSNSFLPIRNNLSTGTSVRYIYLFDWWHRGQYSTLLSLNFRYNFGIKKEQE